MASLSCLHCSPTHPVEHFWLLNCQEIVGKKYAWYFIASILTPAHYKISIKVLEVTRGQIDKN